MLAKRRATSTSATFEILTRSSSGHRPSAITETAENEIPKLNPLHIRKEAMKNGFSDPHGKVQKVQRKVRDDENLKKENAMEEQKNNEPKAKKNKKDKKKKAKKEKKSKKDKSWL